MKCIGFISKIAAAITILVGLLVLAGWVFNVPVLKSVLPGIVEMKFNTAIFFILSGVALYLLDEPALIGPKKSLALICSWLVFSAGLMNLSQHVFGWNLGIDELLCKEGPGAIATSSPGRMSLNTSINFTLLSLVFLLIDKRKYNWLIQVVCIFIFSGR